MTRKNPRSNPMGDTWIVTHSPAPRSNPYRMARGFRPGMRVQVSGGGVDNGKVGTVVDWSEVRTNGRGIPTNIPGAYSPPDRKKEVPVRLDSGVLITMFTNRLSPVRSNPSSSDSGVITKYRSADGETAKIVLNDGVYYVQFGYAGGPFSSGGHASTKAGARKLIPPGFRAVRSNPPSSGSLYAGRPGFMGDKWIQKVLAPDGSMIRNNPGNHSWDRPKGSGTCEGCGIKRKLESKGGRYRTSYGVIGAGPKGGVKWVSSAPECSAGRGRHNPIEPMDTDRFKTLKMNPGHYSERHPTIVLSYREPGGKGTGKLRSVAGLHSFGSVQPGEWQYHSTTRWFPTVKAAVAEARAKMPEYEWRGAKAAKSNPRKDVSVADLKAQGYRVKQVTQPASAGYLGGAGVEHYAVFGPDGRRASSKVSTHRTARDAWENFRWQLGDAEGRVKENPAYRVLVEGSGTPGSVRKALKGAGFDKIRVSTRSGGAKRKPGAYALFVKANMPKLMASGSSAGQAMKQVAQLWRAKKGGAKANPSGTKGPWKTMSEIRAAAAELDSPFFTNKPRRGSTMEREGTIKGPYNGRYIVVPKQVNLPDGWQKSGLVYRVEDDGRIRHVETLWGPSAWENAVDMAKGLPG